MGPLIVWSGIRTGGIQRGDALFPLAKNSLSTLTSHPLYKSLIFFTLGAGGEGNASGNIT